MEQTAPSTAYIPIQQDNAYHLFTEALRRQISYHQKPGSQIVILCIGTDRVTGDSLGPMTGYLLARRKQNLDIPIFGTLASPVHAKNIANIDSLIRQNFPEPLVIAVDASLGLAEHIGRLVVGAGSVKPGAGVSKELPAVGDIFITGIVNMWQKMNLPSLQNTRLHTIVQMADLISSGLLDILYIR